MADNLKCGLSCELLVNSSGIIKCIIIDTIIIIIIIYIITSGIISVSMYVSLRDSETREGRGQVKPIIGVLGVLAKRRIGRFDDFCKFVSDLSIEVDS